VVTGGSKGIGESIVRRFCEAGAHCVIVSRHLDECQALADELKAAGMTASAFACDVSKVAQIKNLVADTVKQFGRIDVLVNSAGVVRRKYAVEYTEEDWDFIMDINLKGAYFCSVEVGKQMRNQVLLSAWHRSRIISIQNAVLFTDAARPESGILPEVLPMNGQTMASASIVFHRDSL